MPLICSLAIETAGYSYKFGLRRLDSFRHKLFANLSKNNETKSHVYIY